MNDAARQAREQDRALIRHMAAGQWVLATENQKLIIRVGMIPKEMHDEAVQVLGELPDFHRLHAVALFECAKIDGGMRA